MPLWDKLLKKTTAKPRGLGLGLKGEIKAALYLQKSSNLKILEKNWRCKFGEIDLVAKSPEKELVFIEIKTRSRSPENPWESINIAKRQRLHRLALCYLHTKGLPLETPVRFDVLIVLEDQNNILYEPNAFNVESEI